MKTEYYLKIHKGYGKLQPPTDDPDWRVESFTTHITELGDDDAHTILWSRVSLSPTFDDLVNNRHPFT